MMAIYMLLSSGLAWMKQRLFVLIAVGAGLLDSRPLSAAEGGNVKPDRVVLAANERPSVASCVEAHLAGQELREEGRLLESRARLLACADEACPALVRAECTKFLDDLRGQVPSVVFHATVDGVVRSDVRVLVEEREICSELSTRAQEFDPGKYRFRFELANFPPIEREVNIAEGERLVPVSVEFKSERSTQPIRRRPAAVPSVAPGERRPIPWTVYAFAGLGAAGLAGFSGVGMLTRHRESELRSSCWPTCSEEQVDSVKSQALIADASLVIGCVALALAGTLYLVRPSESVQIGGLLSPLGRAQPQLQVRF
ncbi:MAG TPA: hypothetical protein VKP30_10375 [Polyangiaceae bacterium]|nr:hypothetical protein [Polyangiaceae bacterium]